MRLWHRYFPVNCAKFLRTPFLQNTSGRLFLALLRHKFSVYTQVKCLQLGLCSASQISPVSVISLISCCFMCCFKNNNIVGVPWNYLYWKKISEMVPDAKANG